MLDITHPAHVHVTKYMVKTLQDHGHQILVTARDKDITMDLLKAYGIDHIIVSDRGNGIKNFWWNWIKRDMDIYHIAKKFNPDMFFGPLNLCTAHASKLLGKKSIYLEDTDLDTFTYKLSTITSTAPFCDVICTPTGYKLDLGKRQVRFSGYKELAYLHPSHFTPDPSILDDLGLAKDDKFIVMRFVAWKAVHDVGEKGFDLETKLRFVKELEKKARVLITSESKLEKELEPYRIKVPPARIHDLLYYAQALIGDSQTMTTEAAILGTPAIRCNSFVGKDDMSNFIELEKKYDLIYSFENIDDALQTSLEILGRKGLKNEWSRKRDRLLKDKIDVTAFMVWLIENYPESFKKIKGDPDFWNAYRDGRITGRAGVGLGPPGITPVAPMIT